MKTVRNIPSNSTDKPRISGGQAGVRGYLVQTLVALLDIVLVENFLEITLEPSHEAEKFDIIWHDEVASHAIQVKSIEGQFSAANVTNWAKQLLLDGVADDYTLFLVGLFPPSLAKKEFIEGVKLDRKNLDLAAFNEQAILRMEKLLRKHSLAVGGIQYREMLVNAFLSRLITLSVGGIKLPRDKFIAQLLEWIGDEGDVTDQDEAAALWKRSQERLLTQTNATSISLKYSNRLYVRRFLEDDIEIWLNRTKDEESTCFLVLAPAGCGKTNILCNAASRSSSARPTFLLTGGQIRLDERLGIWGMIAETVIHDHIRSLERSTIVEAIFRTSATLNTRILIVIDAINEYHEPTRLKRELQIFLGEAKSAGILVLVSCRDYYWGLFEGSFWEEFIRAGKEKAKLNRKVLGNFSPQEAEEAFKAYFSFFEIRVSPEGNALEQFRHPLLLRFFCETHKSRRLGILRDIRLKDLFDNYWAMKLTSIAERMLEQSNGLAMLGEIKNHVGQCLLGVAGAMLNANMRVIPRENALNLTDSAQGSTLLSTPYGRILDEHIILEEIPQYGKNTITLVAFVFEEFMEYAMARFLVNSWRSLPEQEIALQLVELTKKYQSFNQVFGVALYSGLMLKSEHNLSLWTALIGLGSTWEKVVIEAFKKLPEDQIDDTVFEAIIELLKLPRREIQVAALELLKFGRLGRVPPTALIDAVGELAIHKDLRIRRRALMVLSICPANAATPWIERSVTSKIYRLDDQYVILKIAVESLVAFQTPEAIRVIAVCLAGYSHAEHRGFSTSKLKEEFCSDTVHSLLRGENLLESIGAIIILGHSGWRSALKTLDRILSNPVTDPLASWNVTWPLWIANDNLKISKHYSRDTIISKQISIHQYFAQHAKTNLIKAVKANDTHSSLVKMAEEALKNPTLPGVPAKIKQWMTLASYYSNHRLVCKILKRGLELRSKGRWTIGGKFNCLRIKSSRGRLVQGCMTEADFAELRALLSLEKLSRSDNVEEGIAIHNNLRDHDYWKEFIFRAWGEEPEIRGRTEESWD